MKFDKNTKIKLTLGQLKRLVKESSKKKINEGPGAGYTVTMRDIELKSATATLTNGTWKVTGECTFTGYAEGYDWSSEEQEYTGQFEWEVTDYQLNAYAEKYLPDWEAGTVEDNKEMLERVSAYSIDTIEEMIGRGYSHVKWSGILETLNAGFDLSDRYVEDGNFDIQLYDMGSPSDEVNACYYSIDCDEFAQDVEAAYQSKYEDDEEEIDEHAINESGMFHAERDVIEYAKSNGFKVKYTPGTKLVRISGRSGTFAENGNGEDMLFHLCRGANVSPNNLDYTLGRGYSLTLKVDDRTEEWLNGGDPYAKFYKGLDDDSLEVNESSRHFTQRELRSMIRTGEAIDITDYSFDEAKKLRDRGYDVVGVSSGMYGLNGALLEMSDTGDLCAITVRNTILAYLV